MKALNAWTWSVATSRLTTTAALVLAEDSWRSGRTQRMNWFGTLGDSIVDLGAPFGPSSTVGPHGRISDRGGADIGVKLPPDGLDEVIAVGGDPFGPRERPMGGYVAVPRSMDDADVRALASRALSRVASMPAKAPRKPKAK